MPPTMSVNQPGRRQFLEEMMGSYADLMQRLLEMQNGERRSPKLIAEDERLMRGLQKRHLEEQTPPELELARNP
jgi:hypothetical protein